MTDIRIASNPSLYVQWGCRRCGFMGGIARTTIPVQGWNAEMIAHLLLSLKRKLIRKHLDRHGCVATVEDFKLERVVPQGKTLIDTV